MTEEEKAERTAETEEAAAEKSPQPEGAPKEGAAEAPGEKKVELTEKEYAELRKKAEERDEYLNMFLRAKADFQNYQKRARKEMEALNHLAVQDVKEFFKGLCVRLSDRFHGPEEIVQN